MTLDADQPAVPDAVGKAVKLMYVGAALVPVELVAGAVHLGRQDVPGLYRAIAIAFYIVNFAILALLWVLVARACRRGSARGRLLAFAVFAICATGWVLNAQNGVPVEAAFVVVNVLSWLVGLAAVALLWGREATDYFQAGRTVR